MPVHALSLIRLRISTIEGQIDYATLHGDPFMDLKRMFPKASSSFLDANPQLANPGTPIKAVPGAILTEPKARRGKMNNTELEMAFILEAMKRRGEIESYRFEGVTLKLADGCRYCPDFFIVVSSLILRLRFAEVKGAHIWEDSKIKFRVAKEQNPWAEWQMWQKDKSGWNRLF